MSCSAASKLFARFTRGGQPGFSVARIGGGGGGNTELGQLCSDTYTVNAGSQVGLPDRAGHRGLRPNCINFYFCWV